MWVKHAWYHTHVKKVLYIPSIRGRSRAEISRHQQKQEMAKTEGSKDKSSESLARKESWSLSHSPRDPTGKPILHQVWVETAALLVEQVYSERSNKGPSE